MYIKQSISMGTQSKDSLQLPEFRSRKAFSPQEILAAGGTTAFAKKAGQSNENLINALNSSPDVEPFTEEEWKEALAQLKEESAL